MALPVTAGESYREIGLGYDGYHGALIEGNLGYDFGRIRLGASAVYAPDNMSVPGTKAYSWLALEVGIDLTENLQVLIRPHLVETVLLRYSWDSGRYAQVGAIHWLDSGLEPRITFSIGTGF